MHIAYQYSTVSTHTLPGHTVGVVTGEAQMFSQPAAPKWRLRLPGLGATDSVRRSRDRMPSSLGSMKALLVCWALSKAHV